ncbi:MAG: hypothetical protein K8S62_02890 [Candidatus Sabulitectum sp.]|nr:hypothetical protein [Candidatus Sabulitectum sp.]
MRASLKRNSISPALLAAFIVIFPAAAQYAGIPGEVPPLPDSYLLDVGITEPCCSAFSIPGITDEEAERMENPGKDEIIYRCNGVTIARLEYFEKQYDFAYVFAGEWGLSYERIDNEESISQISPSGRYYAVGADGTCYNRGPVYVIDLETGVKYSTTTSGVWGCSDWIEGDYLLIESVGGSDSAREMWTSREIQNMPWINDSYRTGAEGCSNNFVLYRGGSSWMILPEDRYYRYSSRGIPGLYENGIFFDVMAEANVIPSLAGIRSPGDFSEWIDSTGYDNAFPNSYFRVYADTRTNSVSDIRQMDPGMVAEGYLNAVKGGNIYGMLHYLSLTWTQRNAITTENRETVENMLLLFSCLEYRICEVIEDGDRADVNCEMILLGHRTVNFFSMVNDSGIWRIEDWKSGGSNGSSVISGNRTDGWFSPAVETMLTMFSFMIFGRET